jgi:hypothetical protein
MLSLSKIQTTLIVVYKDLQLPVQSMAITTNVVNLNLNPVHGKMYNIMW